MKDLSDLDFTKTIYDYDYTHIALSKMNKVISSEDFLSMDSDMIFDYLMNEIEIVVFGDYLKRYIYEKFQLKQPFRQISDDVFIDIIIDSFKQRRAPYSLTPTTRRRGTIVKSWLSSSQVSRTGVFAIAFGLGMSATETSEFLTKVIKEEDFDLYDVTESVYWYCLDKGLNYSAAEYYLECYDKSPADYPSSGPFWNLSPKEIMYALVNERTLKEYFSFMKTSKQYEQRKSNRTDRFIQLYRRACSVIKSDYWGEEDSAEVTPADIEKILYSSVPTTPAGNLMKMSMSVLSDQFSQKRMSRQRIDSLLKGTSSVDRFDFITLLFLIYAINVEEQWPVERALKYLDEINQILVSCDMSEIYPVNPYESFVIMCMLTDYPLFAYSDVWGKSYE